MSERRLHPVEVLFAVGDSVRELLVPIALAVVLGSGGPGLRAVVLGVLGLGAAAAVGWVRWTATTYTVREEALRFKRGVFSPDVTVVPRARMTALDLVQGPVQRLFGVVEVVVQTAGGGGEPEVRLRALDRGAADELGRALELPVSAPPPPAWRLGPGRLALAALTAPQLGVLAPLLGALAAGSQTVFESAGVERLLGLLPEDLGGGLLLAALVLAAAWALSIAGAVVAFAGFEVAVEGDRLRVRRGLLQRRAATVTVVRVHGVRIVENPLRQPLGLCAVRLETAGGRDDTRAARTLVPLATRAEAQALVARLLPALGGEAPELRGPPGRARRRYVLAPLAVAAPPAAVLALLVPAAWAGALALPVLAAGYGALRFADAGWQLSPDRVAIRERDIARTTLLARADRLQEQTVARTPLQVRAGLADLSVTVGSGAVGRVRHLEAEQAEGLFAALAPNGAGADRRR